MSMTTTCPFCQSFINDGAVVCPCCAAKKGYMYLNCFYFDKESILPIVEKDIQKPKIFGLFMIILSFIGVVGFFAIVKDASTSMAMMVTFGILALSSPGFIICGIFSLISYFRLKSKVDTLAQSGPKWYINTR